MFVVFTWRTKDGLRFLRPISARYMHKKEVTSHEKEIPDFKTDAEAEEFVATADLSEYDLSDMTPMRFELRKKDKAVSLRLPEKLYEAVKARAARAGIPYQRFIRMAIEQALSAGRTGGGEQRVGSSPASRGSLVDLHQIGYILCFVNLRVGGGEPTNSF